MEEETEHHHHHHSSGGEHHHSSGGEHHHSSSGSSGSSHHHHSSSGDYSLRSFGKKGVDGDVLPEGTISGALFAAFVVILILGPIIIALLYRNKSLKEEIFSLRTQLGAVMEQAEDVSAVSPSSKKKTVKPRYVSSDSYSDFETTANSDIRAVSPVNPAEAVRAALEEEEIEEDEEEIVDDEEDEVEETEGDDEAHEVIIRKVAVSAPVKPHPVIQEEQIAKAVNMSMDEIAAIKRDIALEPNGMWRETDEDGVVTFVPEPFVQNLQGAFSLLSLGQTRDAEAIFGMLSSSKPLWPYGHFFKAVAGRDKGELAKANLLFSTVRALGVQTPESELYSALTSIFLKSDSTAESTLLRIPAMMIGQPALQIGVIPVPKSAPQEIRNKIKAIPGVGDIIEIEW